MAISLNGSTNVITGVSVGGLPDGIVDTDMLAANAVSSAKLASGAGGKILQVVSAEKTDKFSSTDTNQFITVSGLTVNITPSSSSNKIFICFMMNIGHSATTHRIGGKIFRSSDSQNIFRSATDGNRTRAYVGSFTCHSNATNTMRFVSPCYLDTPSTTNQVSYTFQLYNTTGTIYVNRSGENSNESPNPDGASFAYAMEVAA